MRASVTGSLAAGTILAVLVAGCGQDQPAPHTDDTGTPSAAASHEPSASAASSVPIPQASSPASPPPSADDVVVELVDPGAEPRHEMRLDPEVGASTTVEMRMTMAMESTVDGQAAPGVEIPPMVMVMTVTVDEVAPERLSLSYSYDGVSVDGPDPAGVEDVLATMEGLAGTFTTTRRGAYLEGDVTAPPGIDPTVASMLDQFEQQMSSMAVPFPQEGVGVGAVWQATTGFEVNGVSTVNTMTYELRAWDDDTYELGLEIDQQILPATIQEGGATVEILEGANSGAGTMAGTLRLPIATRGNTELAGSMLLEVASEGQTAQVEQSQQAEMEMTSR